jgi:signal transduction histidine kinase
MSVAASLDSAGEQRRFLAYAAHELRTPIATQRALLELALADADADVAAWREIGEDVLGACRRQEHLIESCLTLARSREGPRRRQPVDLAEITVDALAAQDPRALEYVVDLVPARTTGDPDLLARLAANLVSNAVRHNVEGGRVEVATRAEGRRAVLAVANTGRPIAAGELGRLVQPFQRLAPHPASAADGVGLGLSIVDAVAVVHGATLTVRARAGGGLAIDVAFRALD